MTIPNPKEVLQTYHLNTKKCKGPKGNIVKVPIIYIVFIKDVNLMSKYINITKITTNENLRLEYLRAKDYGPFIGTAKELVLQKGVEMNWITRVTV